VLFLATAASAQPPRITEAFPHLPWQRPVYLTHFGDGTGRIVLAQQDGRVFWFANDRDTKTIYELIDLRKRVGRKGNEEGLIGLAFDPDVKKTRHVYLHYTLTPEKKNVLSRFTMNEALSKADPASEQVILTVDQPYANHNGGAVEFGPDGFLYVALGDGGSANDPHNNAQDLSNLLGKVLRIDVRNAGEKPYAVPDDNPFVGAENARPEIWAYGLRNVWRMSFDPATGVLYGGDVGQDKWEEIDVIERGGNYGWSVLEGAHAFKPDQKREGATYIPPIAEHSHAQAKSITGGYVYRGKAIPSLAGAYIYGDFETGLIWSLRYDPQTGKATAPQFVGHAPQIASFGVDEAGELYVCSLTGKVYKFVPQSSPVTP
jgi:glucose/arabinose dehydrogenase